MKIDGTGSINTANYEEWLLLCIDNELTPEQKITVEKFTAAHPSIQQEFELLLKTRLCPEPEIVFQNKELLYRYEEKIRVMTINWRKIAVAAALIAISVTAFVISNSNNDGINEELASADAQPGKKSTSVNTINQTPVEINNTDPITAESSSNPANKTTGSNNPIVSEGKKLMASKEKNSRPSALPIKEKDPVVADNNSRDKKTNDLPQPTYNPNVKNDPVAENPIARMDITEKKSLTDSNENIEDRDVTTPGSQPLNKGLTFAATESVDPADDEQSGKKNKFRGFFRKVTRTLEKTTNIKTTDDEDRLLLGGLAIKL